MECSVTSLTEGQEINSTITVRSVPPRQFRMNKRHLIFVIDKSGSMDAPRVQPKSTYFAIDKLKNALGSVYEISYKALVAQESTMPQQQDIFSVILFDDKVTVPFLKRNIQDKNMMYSVDLLKNTPSGGTKFQAALNSLSNILNENSSAYDVLVLFLTDGEDSVSQETVKSLSTTFKFQVKICCVAFGMYAVPPSLVSLVKFIQQRSPQIAVSTTLARSYEETEAVFCDKILSS